MGNVEMLSVRFKNTRIVSHKSNTYDLIEVSIQKGFFLQMT